MSIDKNSVEKFYDGFHKTTTASRKFITAKNFTYENIIKLLNREIPNVSSSEILDFGCGSGSISFYLASKGAKVCGYDLSKKAIETCNESKQKNNCKNVDFTNNLTKLKGKYDYIISIEVIEHIKDDLNTVKFLRTLLKKGGKLILSTPSLNAPLYKLNLLSSFDDRVGHLRRYSIVSLKNLALNANFKDIHIFKNEGIFRNLLYTSPIFGNFIKFLKWPMSTVFNRLDNFTIEYLGESDLILVATKP